MTTLTTFKFSVPTLFLTHGYVHSFSLFLSLSLSVYHPPPPPWYAFSGDSGKGRAAIDGVITAGVPLTAVLQPSAANRFLTLTSQKQTLHYGDHPLQVVHLCLPSKMVQNAKGLVYFVVCLIHGIDFIHKCARLSFASCRVVSFRLSHGSIHLLFHSSCFYT